MAPDPTLLSSCVPMICSGRPWIARSYALSFGRVERRTLLEYQGESEQQKQAMNERMSEVRYLQGKTAECHATMQKLKVVSRIRRVSDSCSFFFYFGCACERTSHTHRPLHTGGDQRKWSVERDHAFGASQGTLANPCELLVLLDPISFICP